MGQNQEDFHTKYTKIIDSLTTDNTKLNQELKNLKAKHLLATEEHEVFKLFIRANLVKDKKNNSIDNKAGHL